MFIHRHVICVGIHTCYKYVCLCVWNVMYIDINRHVLSMCLYIMLYLLIYIDML
jgi:hypothetical protein